MQLDRADPRVWLGVAAVLFITAVAGYLIAAQSFYGVFKLALLAGGAIFFLLSPRWWWVPVPASFAIGGVLYFGFKVYTHELAIVLCAAPLFFARAVNPRSVQQSRRSVPVILLLLLGYLCIHLAFSLGVAKFSGEKGYGNILRHYTWALWPLCFGVLFHLFGSTRFLKHALFLLFGAYFVRVGVTLLTYVFPAFLYIPFVNFVLPGSTAGEAADLRTGALGLGSLAICYACIARFWGTRLLFAFLTLGAFASLLLGAGRVSLAMFLLLPVLAALAQRRFVLLLMVCGLMIGGVWYLNLNPRALESFEPRIQRTLGVLVIERGAARIHADTEMSDLWHSRLRQLAVDRWLGSGYSFFFGTRVKKFEPDFFYVPSQSELTFERAVDRAGDVGAYETGWFSLLAITGSVGLVLYLAALYWIMRAPVSHLLRHGINDVQGAFCFLTVYTTLMWLVFGWTYGAYPSYEIMLGVIANYACLDAARENAAAANPAASAVEAADRAPGLAGAPG